MSPESDIQYDDKHWHLDLTCGEETFARYQELAKEDLAGFSEILNFSEVNEIDIIKFDHKINLTNNPGRYARFAGRLISIGLTLFVAGTILYTILYMFVSGD